MTKVRVCRIENVRDGETIMHKGRARTITDSYAAGSSNWVSVWFDWNTCPHADWEFEIGTKVQVVL